MFRFKERIKKKKKEERRQVVLKYIELGIIMLLFVGIVFSLRTWYLNDLEYQKAIPVLQDILYEIRSDEIENFIYENENALLYVGVASDDKCRSLEETLKPYIEQNNLKEVITYLNITNVTDISSFYRSFNEQFQLKDGLSSYPTFVLFKDGKIEATLSEKDNTITIEQLQTFLQEHEVEGYGL